jgi:mRNA-degrading endonuclease toxin of MazEF toxin-antitoxin module
MPEMVRAVSRERLVERGGVVRDATLEQVLQRVRLLMRSP